MSESLVPVRVLFVCIGNSCRSQMAEAFARHTHQGIMRPSSAGISPAPIIQPETISVMATKGLSLDGQCPKHIREVAADSIDYIVNMSGSSTLAHLPQFRGRNLMWHVDDPMGHPLEVYTRVRDQIEQLVSKFAKNLENLHAR